MDQLLKCCTLGIDYLLQQASQLHDNVWQVFQSAKGDKLEALLRGDIL